ncbi:hypothetical protein N431DRAFT_457086 [Stipitochalara longipes BDJ]|nr:hypothetical protein N431DRAFT_457086 [Stipitochalara longipes BDJ]
MTGLASRGPVYQSRPRNGSNELQPASQQASKQAADTLTSSSASVTSQQWSLLRKHRPGVTGEVPRQLAGWSREGQSHFSLLTSHSHFSKLVLASASCYQGPCRSGRRASIAGFQRCLNPLGLTRYCMHTSGVRPIISPISEGERQLSSCSGLYLPDSLASTACRACLSVTELRRIPMTSPSQPPITELFTGSFALLDELVMASDSGYFP